MARAVIVAPGPVQGQVVPAWARGDALVVAADAGVHLALELGLRPDAVVGDLDSVDPSVLVDLRDAGVVVEDHPSDKDHTDLELALRFAMERGATRLTALGGGGGRLDHLLGNVAALAGAATARPGVEVEAWAGGDLVLVVTGTVERSLPAGTLVSLIAWGGPAGVRVDGLRWPVGGGELRPDEARGVSNEALGGPVRVAVDHGVVLVVLPGDAGAAAGREPISEEA